jgi:hypothetical protein
MRKAMFAISKNLLGIQPMSERLIATIEMNSAMGAVLHQKCQPFRKIRCVGNSTYKKVKRGESWCASVST